MDTYFLGVGRCMNEGDISDITDIKIEKPNKSAFMKSTHNHFLIGGNYNERNSVMRQRRIFKSC